MVPRLSDPSYHIVNSFWSFEFILVRADLGVGWLLRAGFVCVCVCVSTYIYCVFFECVCVWVAWRSGWNHSLGWSSLRIAGLGVHVVLVTIVRVRLILLL